MTAGISEMPLVDRPVHSFIHDLSFKDLERLRALARLWYSQWFPNSPTPSLLTIDGIINECGPKAAEKLLRDGVDRKLGV